VSLSRLADRHYLSESDLTDLSAAYEFLRRTEHVLQMENGLQTHVVPDNPEKRELLAKRVTFPGGTGFETGLQQHTGSVSRIFSRVFGEPASLEVETEPPATEMPTAQERSRSHILDSIEKSEFRFRSTAKNVAVLDRLTAVSPHFAAMLAANPHLAKELPDPDKDLSEPDHMQSMLSAVEEASGFGPRLSAMRRLWSRFLLEIVVLDLFERIGISEAKRLQTLLAEASIAAALRCVRDELGAKHGANDCPLDLAVLALGKLGGRGLDYGSDLDLILVFDDTKPVPDGESHAEYYSRAAELFVSALSSMTRDGNLYRVDLRLRPYGSKGLTTISAEAFLGYMNDTAAVWEMLAFVKLRAVGGELDLGERLENETRRIIHQRATGVDPTELRNETLRIRYALEKQRSLTRRGSEIDIKYGSGGMLDIYFAMRYLQLRDDVPDDRSDRSTSHMLGRLCQSGSISEENYAEFAAGYAFLSELDHNIRLTVGRTPKLPLANQNAVDIIALRLGLATANELVERLTMHRLSIRSIFEGIVGH
jgi:glutamate-ammonia-ligase adenylyltransferase